MQDKELFDAYQSLREYIEAIPDDVAATLPAMPGVSADWLDEVEQKMLKALNIGEYGCHIDLDENEYDSCVLDGGNWNDCVYAVKHGKEARKFCGEWEPITIYSKKIG